MLVLMIDKDEKKVTYSFYRLGVGTAEESLTLQGSIDHECDQVKLVEDLWQSGSDSVSFTLSPWKGQSLLAKFQS